jgi:hypothetical protein
MINRFLKGILLICTTLVLQRADAKTVAGAFSQSKLTFIENKGQIVDQNGAHRKDIDFKLEANGVTVFIGGGQLHYQWNKIESEVRSTKCVTQIDDRSPLPAPRSEIYRLDVTLVGANKNAIVETEDQQNYSEHYYLPQCPDGAIAQSYKKIIYKNIYPNIDWVLFVAPSNSPQRGEKISSPPPGGGREGLKYDFIIHPGGDAKDIQLKYDGATSLALKDGALTATTPFGSITEEKPYSYEAETGKEIGSAFITKENVLSFKSDVSDKTVVLDPKVDWCTFFGGAQLEDNVHVGTDIAGNAYLTGGTYSSNNIATTGAFLTTKIGNSPDGFIAKFNMQGQRMWSTYYGGTGTDYIVSNSYDSSYIYAAGFTYSDTGIATPGSHQTSLGNAFGFGDAFLIKLDTNGNRLWATYYGGNAEESPYNGNPKGIAVVCDHFGFVYLAGSTNSTNNIATTGSFQSNKISGNDCYLVKFTSGGKRVWGTYFSPSAYPFSGNTFLCDAVCDSKGNIYAAGSTQFTVLVTNYFSTPGSFQQNCVYNFDGFLIKFDSSGHRKWATYYGDSSNDYIHAVVTDSNDNVYVAGKTNSINRITTPGSYQPLYAGTPLNNPDGDGFLAKFDSSGTRQWATYFGGSGADKITGLGISRLGTIFLSGTTNSTSDIATPDGFQNSFTGTAHMNFITEFSKKGTRLWASYFGTISTGFDQNSLVYNNINRIFFGGWSNQPGLSTPGSYQPNISGGADAFLATFIVDTTVHIEQPFNDTILCVVDSFYLNYTVNTPFNTNNVFTVQLSNDTGGFVNPVNIGTVSNYIPGEIHCFIPSNTPAGTGYRIRIIASSPRDTSLPSTQIRISKYPIPIAYTNSPVCEGDQLNIGVSSSTPVLSYQWTGPIAPIIAQSITYPNATLTLNGDYIVEADYYGCKAKDTISVLVKPTPVKPTFASDTSVCAGDTIHLSANSITPGVNYQWYGVNGFTGTTKDTIILNAATNMSGYYKAVAVLNGCPSLSDSAKLIVHPIPAPVATANTPICAGETIMLSAADTTTGVKFTWVGVGGFLSSAKDTNMANSTTSMSGDYVVTAAAFGCIERDTVTVLVKPVPTKPVLSSNSPICEKEELVLHAADSTVGVNYNWTGPDNFNSTQQNPTITVATTKVTGLYTAVVNLNGCINKDTLSVKIKPVIIPEITVDSPIYLGQDIHFKILNPVTGVSYYWIGANNYYSAFMNPVIYHAKLEDNGVYIANIVLDGCIGSAAIGVTVHDVADTGLFKLYPNPNNGNFKLWGIVFKDQEVPIRIYNTAGQLIFSKEAVTNNHILEEDFSLPVASGVYHLHTRITGKNMDIPFVIKK